jgi:hypothetical protein
VHPDAGYALKERFRMGKAQIVKPGAFSRCRRAKHHAFVSVNRKAKKGDGFPFAGNPEYARFAHSLQVSFRQFLIRPAHRFFYFS